MAAKKAATTEETDEQYEPIEYDFEREIPIEDSDEVEIEVTTVVMNWPGKGQLTLMIADSAENQTAAMMNLFKKTLSPSHLRFIRAGLASEEITIAQLQEMVVDAVEEWSTFPTKRRSASTASPQRTGTRSTGRSPGAGSTRSTSSRGASSRSS